MKSLESLGHTVVTLQERQVTGDDVLSQALRSDLFVWVHTHGWNTPGAPMKYVLEELKAKNIPTISFHLDLWMGLERQKDMQSDEFWGIEHFFVTDKLMADYLNTHTKIKGHFLPAGVFHEEVYLTNQPKTHDVIFTGSKGYHPEWPYRPQLINWLADTYKDRFEHWGGDGKGTIRGAALNDLYASTKVTVGDTLCIGFNYPWYSSDRLFESTGRGAFVIYPRIKGLETFFRDGKEVVFYEFNNFVDLKEKIDYYLEHEEEREEIRMAGFERTKNEHTYIHRWQTILKEIFPNG